MLLADISDDRPPLRNTIGIRARLKAETSAAHHALDERLGAFDLTSTPHYRRFLQASAAALLTLERALEQAGVAQMFDDWPRRSRARAITADLASLGGRAVPLPLPEQSFDRNGVFGTLYVLEGSRLGAAYLLRIASASADPRVRSAMSYLRHGAGQGLWGSFLARLEAEPVTPDDEMGMIVSAQAAFAMFAKAVATA